MAFENWQIAPLQSPRKSKIRHRQLIILMFLMCAIWIYSNVKTKLSLVREAGVLQNVCDLFREFRINIISALSSKNNV